MLSVIMHCSILRPHPWCYSQESGSSRLSGWTKILTVHHFLFLFCHIHLTDFHSSCPTTTCMLLSPSALQLLLAAKIWFSQTDRTINYVISYVVNLYIQMKPLRVQHISLPLGILISEQTLVQLCCKELTDLKAKSHENIILHLHVNCTLNSSCNYLLFSLSLGYFFSHSSFAYKRLGGTWPRQLAQD